MLYMNPSTMVHDKIERLLKGQTAYAESKELIRLLKREVEKRGISVYIDDTNNGCWFIPKEKKAQ
ncbi:hypothetical protein N781_09950 [Pontibacillus halophilus JSM 076056 = DSM 19796]|uniref:Uncharacterized protein n=1 Tax=Pontibacillus halophilus JSM 076056 = DSM 19796 TaxID=1385510 RepID=A0A0A5GMZ7_9BACI|nr:hypothetical protein [Pontibacillus halophilus]KGX93369.1 hypothetical protein N781_09950 [Pontibacillus halophilus JSM 076056 = DSM 19796]